MTNLIRNLVSKEKNRYQNDGFDLDLSYVTPRLIAMGYPSDKLEGIYRNKMSEVRRFFLQKHFGHYKVYNLCSERSYSPKHFLNATASFPFDDHNPCEFHMLIQFCEDAKTYLDQDPKNVIAVHCKAGKGRTGLVLCCYLQFTKEAASAAEALEFYAEARTRDRRGVTIPSQIRWVEHFGTYLRYRWLGRDFPVRGVPVVITHIEIHGYPAFFDPNLLMPHLKITKMDKSLIWDSKLSSSTPVKWYRVSPFISIKCEIVVSGDFHLMCYNNSRKLFGLWEHSSFLLLDDAKEHILTYRKSELDGPAKDCKRHEKFPKEFHVVLVCRSVDEMDGADEKEDGKKEAKDPLLKVRNPIKKLVSKKKLRFQQDGFDLDLSYITPSIIAMGFPSINLEGMYRNKMSDVIKFLRHYHEGHYKVYNLCSERTYTADHFQNNCASYPFDDHNPCPFKTLVKFCDDAAEFGRRDPRNCRAIHCKAGKGRTGLVISALLLLEGVCDSADAALEFYGSKRTSNVKGVTIPSQRRYVHYYEDYLRCYVKPGRAFSFTGPVITLIGFHLNPCIEFSGGGCAPYFKVSVMDKTVLYNHKSDKRGKLVKWKKGQPGWACQCHVQCQGDIHIVFYDNNNKMFGFWLHTAFIKTQSIVLEKEDLDGASNDKKHQIFAENFNCQVFFAGVEEDAQADAAIPGFRSHVMGPQDISKWKDSAASAEKTEAEEDGSSASEDDPGEVSDDEYLEGVDPEEASEDEKRDVSDGVPRSEENLGPKKVPLSQPIDDDDEGSKPPPPPPEEPTPAPQPSTIKRGPSHAAPRKSGFGENGLSLAPTLNTKPVRHSGIGVTFSVVDTSRPEAPPTPKDEAGEVTRARLPSIAPEKPPPQRPPPTSSPIVGPPLEANYDKHPDFEHRMAVPIAPTKRAPAVPTSSKRAPGPPTKPVVVVVHRPARKGSMILDNTDDLPPPPPPEDETGELPEAKSEVVLRAPLIEIELTKLNSELEALSQMIVSVGDAKMQVLLENSRTRTLALKEDAEKRLADAVESDALAVKFENMVLMIGARLSDDRPDWDKIVESCGFTPVEQRIILDRLKTRGE